MSNRSNDTQIQALRTDLENCLDHLVDPLSLNKKEQLNILDRIQSRLLALNAIPYFCRQCGFSHKTGEIYMQHKNDAEFRPQYPPVKIYRPERSFFAELENMNRYQIAPILDHVLKGVILQLTLERNKIVVLYEGKPIGELGSGKSKTQQTIAALKNPNYQVNCYLEQYSPKEFTKIITERWSGTRKSTVSERFENVIEEVVVVLIQLINYDLFARILQGLLEMVEYHPDPLPAFTALGPRVVQELEKAVPHHSSPKLLEILNHVHMHFRITREKQFSLLL